MFVVIDVFLAESEEYDFRAAQRFLGTWLWSDSDGELRRV